MDKQERETINEVCNKLRAMADALENTLYLELTHDQDKEVRENLLDSFRDYSTQEVYEAITKGWTNRQWTEEYEFMKEYMKEDEDIAREDGKYPRIVE